MKKGVSQSILTIFLASVLLFGTIMIASNSNGNTMMMTTMQSAEAEEFISTPVNQVNSCDEDAGSADNDNCTNGSATSIDSVTQTPPLGGSNIFDVLITHDQLNDCDESGPGDNEAECANTLDSSVVGPIDQENNPSNNPVGSNEIDINIDNDQVNDCDESGANGGTNFADCNNLGNTDVGTSLGISQFNLAVATDNLDNPNFAEVNSIDTFQRIDQLNTCSEMQVDAVNNFCSNDADNFIGPVTQDNIVTGEIPEQPHTNTFAASQIAIQRNDCDETGGGASIDLSCTNGDADFENTLESVDQDNTATNADNAVQTNDATSLQSVDSNNDCNESDDGDNTVFCDNDGENRIGLIDQDNEALGHQDATIFQNNEVDGDDAADIPGINQLITADNTCSEIGVGFNDAFCETEFLDNIIQGVDQVNTINEADSATDIFQDNRGVFSQIIDADNDCDETGIGGGNNDAECTIENAVDNFLGVVSQDNQATGDDNSLFDQDNNVDVSQSIVANNDCNASGNDADCEIGTGNSPPEVNHIESISQLSKSVLIEDAFSNQLNDVSIDQNADLVNTCDESGTGLNDALCRNEEIQNFVGPISQENAVNGEDSAVISETSNKVNIVQDLQATNDCDEADAGINDAFCDNDADNSIVSITQSNTADAIGIDDIDQDNLVSINQNLQTKNDCDESAGGDNDADCEINASNDIGIITQTNDAVGDGDDVFDQDNILSINQNLVAENDCDEFGLGSNLVDCIITIGNEIGSIEQENTDSAPDATNSLTINQDVQAKNNCDDSTSGDNTKICSINLHLVVPDLTQTDGEQLTINQNDFELNSCPGGGTCAISRTTTFDPNNPGVPIITSFAAPSFSLLSSDEKTTSEDTQTEDLATTGTTASFTAASTETQDTTVNDDDNQGSDDDNGNTNPNEDNSKLETETPSTDNEEDEDEQDETEQQEGDDTAEENQNTNNNNDDNQNDDGNDNDQNTVNENDNDTEDEDEDEEEEDEDEEEEDEDEEEEDEGEDAE